MKLRYFSVLLLSLAVSLSALAAKPVLTFEGSEAVVTVPAGHRVAWIYGGSPRKTGLEADSNNDGQVRFTPPSTGSLAVVDVETGEWAVPPYVTGSVLEPPYVLGITADASGHFSIYDAGRTPDRGMLWLRPGVGAWTPPAQWNDPLAVGRDFALIDISTFLPVGASPPAPSGVVAGDSFMSLDGQRFFTGLVDFSMTTTYAGRLYFEDWTSRRVEGRTVTVDVIRRLGTTGTVTTTCAPSFTAVTIPPATRAEVGVDYAAFGAQTVTFAPGEAVKQCSYTLLDDGTFTDLPRYFLIMLTPATGGAHVDYRGGFHTLLIEDDDPVPTLQFGAVPASVVEGDVDQTLSVPWSLTGNFRGEIKVRFWTPSLAPPVEHVLTPGDATRTSPVLIRGNNHSDQTQTIELRLEADYETSRIQRLSRDLAVLDDDAPALQIEDATTAEWMSSVTLPIQLKGIPADRVTVHWTTTNGTAIAGEDFVATSGQVIYDQYVLPAPIQVPIKNDSKTEGTETFYIDITSLTGPAQPLTRTRYIVTLQDDDDPKPVVTLSAAAIVEGTGGAMKEAPVRVQLASAPLSTDHFTLLPAGGTATSGSDYVPFATTVVFAPGETEKIATVSVHPDTVVEADESVVITASSSRWGNLASTTLMIKDDDARTSMSIADTTVVEKTGSSAQAKFRITFSKPPLEGGTVSYKTVDGSANAGSDYAASSGTLQYSAGQTVLLVSVEVFGDAATEQDEKFTVELSGPSGDVSLARDRASATVYDDDAPVARPSLSIDDIAVTESDDVQEVTFTLRLSSAANGPVTVSYETADDSATATTDYGHRSGVVTFAPGETARTIAIPIAGDGVHEETETFTLLLSNASGAILPDESAVCTIADDDPRKRRSARH
ncbi:MAG TPA: Calx-beta domain-containing protein [Thermoanaerobaculia bacterium]